MIVMVNGEEKNIPDNASASELVALLDLQNVKIAMEVNREIIPRSQYAEVKLNKGDSRSLSALKTALYLYASSQVGTVGSYDFEPTKM